MRKAKKTDGITAFSKVLSYILIVLLIAAVAAGAVALFANGGAAFYVEYDGKRYGVSKEKTSLPQKSEYVFPSVFCFLRPNVRQRFGQTPKARLHLRRTVIRINFIRHGRIRRLHGLF